LLPPHQSLSYDQTQNRIITWHIFPTYYIQSTNYFIPMTFITNCRRYLFYTKLGAIFFVVITSELALTIFVIGYYFGSGHAF